MSNEIEVTIQVRQLQIDDVANYREYKEKCYTLLRGIFNENLSDIQGLSYDVSTICAVGQYIEAKISESEFDRVVAELTARGFSVVVQEEFKVC